MSITLPTVGGDADAWGDKLNAALTTLDQRNGFTYQQTTTPTSPSSGQTWLQSDKGWAWRYDGTRWIPTSDDGSLDVRVFGADPTGASDSTSAIQAALDAAKNLSVADSTINREIKVRLGGKDAKYLISGAITYGAGAWLSGEGFHRGGSVIYMSSGADIAAHAFTSTGTLQGGPCFERFKLVDQRASGSRTGVGINLDQVTNGAFVRQVSVSNFYDNIFAGSTNVNNNSDIIAIEHVWATGAVRYGINLNRIANQILLTDISGDSKVAGAQGQAATDTTAALICVGSAQAKCTVTITGVKHENSSDTDTILYTGSANLLANGIVMNNPDSHDPTTPSGTRALLRITGDSNTNSGRNVVARGLGTGGRKSSDATNAIADYFVYVDVSSGTDWGIAPTGANTELPLWIGARDGNRGLGLGKVGLYTGDGAPAFSAPKGSLYLRDDATTTTTRLYVNTDGATTWASFTASA